MAKFGMEEFEEAADLFERAHERSPDMLGAELAAAYAHAGRLEEAEKVLDDLRAWRQKHQPGYPVTVRWVIDWFTFKNPADKQRLADGLRKAGLE